MQEQLPRRVKSSSYISLIPTFSLWRRSRRTCVDTYGFKGGKRVTGSDVYWLELFFKRLCRTVFAGGLFSGHQGIDGIAITDSD